MNYLSTVFRTLKPVIFTVWVVAAIRLALDATSTDPNVIAMASVYAAIFILFVFAGITGYLDRLAWKGLFGGAVMMGVLCFLIPNSISYSVAQFKGWDHTRYHVDKEHYAIYERLQKEEGLGHFAADKKATEVLDRRGTTRGPPVQPTPALKIRAAITIGLITSVIGAIWSLVLGLIFIGIPASIRRGRS